MASETFDYENTDTPDDVVRRVVSEVTGTRLKPLSDEERLERHHWREQLHERDLERRVERERIDAENEAAARAEAAAEIAERNRQMRIEHRERQRVEYEARDRQRDLSALRTEAQASAMWRNGIRGALHQQQTTTLIGELDAMIAGQPTQPLEPESAEYPPEPSVGDPDFFERWNARRSLRSWW
jgi:hypothetical protein